jgi:hypothetical protein
MKSPLSLKKGKYVVPVYNLSLPEETMDQLAGKWDGKLVDLDVIFRFEKVESGGFKGFVDMPRLGKKDLPITDASLSGGKLILKVEAGRGPIEVIGQLSGDKFIGDWISIEGKRIPLTLDKEKP